MHNVKGDDVPIIATVSLLLLEDLFDSLRHICTPDLFARILRDAQIPELVLQQPDSRITHDQLVKLYQSAAVSTGDEMMGLWSRTIRPSALKNICRIVIDAPSVGVALHRFTQVWNLLLDDYAVQMCRTDLTLSVALRGRSPSTTPNRFGHALLLKLTHGIASWLAGRELPVASVALSFPRPDFADDYLVLFPASVSFGAPLSEIVFRADIGELPVTRKASEMHDFLVRAPRDWIFTAFREHSIQLKVREYLFKDGNLDRSLEEAAFRLNMSRRTLIRKLAAEGLSFQKIKDGLRRDIAIRDLTLARKSLDEISESLGFSSVAVFHRAFKGWTGTTPAAYRTEAGALSKVAAPLPVSADTMTDTIHARQQW
jgi:AraC-like DNA-binding protein